MRFADLSFSYGTAGPARCRNHLRRAGRAHRGRSSAAPAPAKARCLALIPRLIDPPQGALWIDGTDIRRLPLQRLRAATGMVPQETFLFSATIRDNIALGRRTPRWSR